MFRKGARGEKKDRIQGSGENQALVLVVQYISKSSRYPSMLIRVPGAVLMALTLTRLCARIITVSIRLEPKIKQVNI